MFSRTLSRLAEFYAKNKPIMAFCMLSGTTQRNAFPKPSALSDLKACAFLLHHADSALVKSLVGLCRAAVTCDTETL